MSSSVKNIVVILIFFTLVLAGYFAYQQRGAASLSFSETDQVTQNVLNRTQVFIERGAVLSELSIDLRLFEDERFRSLQSYSEPVPDLPVGRENPFERPSEGAFGELAPATTE